MCYCTPNIQTPFCGRPGCEWPPRAAESGPPPPEAPPSSAAELWGWANDEILRLRTLVDGANAREAVAVAKLRRLQAALERYGRHAETCGRAHYQGGVPCRCGLDDVREETK